MSSVRFPDLSERPHRLTAERDLRVPPQVVYEAWTRHLDSWFAAPGSVLMTGEVNTPFFFETEYKFEGQEEAQRHPHYGRLLALEPHRRIQMTWVTGARGTEGAETVVTVELSPNDGGTHLRLTHEGFATESARDGHQLAWPMVLEHLDMKLKERVE